MNFILQRTWGDIGPVSPAFDLRTGRHHNGIGIQGDSARPCQCPTLQGSARRRSDRGLCHYRSSEVCVSSKGRRATDLPKHIVRLRTADKDDLAITSCGGECGHDLKNPDRVWIALAIERKIPRYSQRGLGTCGSINAWGRVCPPISADRTAPPAAPAALL